MAAAVNWTRFAGGAARNLAATSRAAVTDLVAAGFALGESLGDAVLGRDREESVLRVGVLILSDTNGPLCTPDDLAPALDAADRIFRTDAGIRVRVTGVQVVTEPAPERALDPGANQRLLLDDMLGHTAFFRDRLPTPGSVGAPVTVVVVRDIAGRTTGCSLGMTADWVVCQRSLFDSSDAHAYDETVLAHEIGHALNLPHHRDRSNLMFPSSSPPDGVRGTALRHWQRTLVRANRHTLPGQAHPR
ncbi:MAG: matrixin family metalloprotease [Nakamurella sp.]